MKILMLFLLFITILTFLYIEHLKFEFIYALTNSSKSLNIELVSINSSFISDGKFEEVTKVINELEKMLIGFIKKVNPEEYNLNSNV